MRHQSLLFAIFLGFGLCQGPLSRIIRFKNNCDETLWVGGVGDPLPTQYSGFELPMHTERDITVSGEMRSARFWARTHCSWQERPEWAISPWPIRFTCDGGDCGAGENNYGVQCGQNSGRAPVSLVEMTLQRDRNDIYDLSNVDGYTIGYQVDVWGDAMEPVPNPDLGEFNCGNATCTLDPALCPEELQKESLIAGQIFCLSICEAVRDEEQIAKYPVLQRIIDNGQKDLVCCNCACGPECGCEDQTSRFCCSPYGNLPDNHGGICDLKLMPKIQTGVFAGLDYEAVFKMLCPHAYSWQFNDFESTYQCVNANYFITFCPLGQPIPPPPPPPPTPNPDCSSQLGSWAGEAILEIDDITDADDCCHQCLEEPACSKWTLDGMGDRCFLFGPTATEANIGGWRRGQLRSRKAQPKPGRK